MEGLFGSVASYGALRIELPQLGYGGRALVLRPGTAGMERTALRPSRWVERLSHQCGEPLPRGTP